jgi:putative ABC transport system permease protein
VRLPESQAGAADSRIPAYVRPVTPGYLEAMGTRVLRGRGPSVVDVPGSERVLVVDAEFARRVWGDAEPIGREVLLDGPPNQAPPRARVVGVVEAMHMNRLDAELRSTMYVPFAQATEGHYLDWGMDVVVRGATPRLEPEIRQAVRHVFPNAAVFRLAPMDNGVAVSTADRRFQLLVLGVFGGLALLLATIGVAGTLLLSVRERGRELAVRVGLGARPDRLWWSVQRDALLLAGSGAVIGAAAARASARVFTTLVYGVSVRDPLALGVGPTLVIVAGFMAAAIPATRALRVSPVSVLRD